MLTARPLADFPTTSTDLEASIFKLPPSPKPRVAAEISPPLETSNSGVLIVKEPAFPVPSVPVNKPLGDLSLIEVPITFTDSEALIFKLPPSPAPSVLALICPPSKTNKLGVFIVNVPAFPVAVFPA